MFGKWKWYCLFFIAAILCALFSSQIDTVMVRLHKQNRLLYNGLCGLCFLAGAASLFLAVYACIRVF